MAEKKSSSAISIVKIISHQSIWFATPVAITLVSLFYEIGFLMFFGIHPSHIQFSTELYVFGFKAMISVLLGIAALEWISRGRFRSGSPKDIATTSFIGAIAVGLAAIAYSGFNVWVMILAFLLVALVQSAEFDDPYVRLEHPSRLVAVTGEPVGEREPVEVLASRTDDDSYPQQTLNRALRRISLWSVMTCVFAIALGYVDARASRHFLQLETVNPPQLVIRNYAGTLLCIDADREHPVVPRNYHVHVLGNERSHTLSLVEIDSPFVKHSSVSSGTGTASPIIHDRTFVGALKHTFRQFGRGGTWIGVLVFAILVFAFMPFGLRAVLEARRGLAPETQTRIIRHGLIKAVSYSLGFQFLFTFLVIRYG